MAFIDTATQWRKQHGYIGKGGVIVIFDGDAQGWMDRLRNPEHWRPGCIAVDELGHSWTAVNGNDQDGAKAWLPNKSESADRKFAADTAYPQSS
ncbi:MAG: hypothetical protein ACRYF6_21690 [Janthinobacterium lividum]